MPTPGWALGARLHIEKEEQVLDRLSLESTIKGDIDRFRRILDMYRSRNADAGEDSAEAQQAKLIELEARLVALQRQAEAVVDRLESDGIQHVQRTCTDQLILLGVERAR